jgi:tetratricopeptide (TPR) repeat protein
MPNELKNGRLQSSKWALALLLVVATFVAYQSVWHAGFIWDDDDHFTKNPAMLSVDGLRQIWSSIAVSRYYPLTLTSFWVERQLWGLHPMPYHLINIALHAANALLLWALLRRLQIRGAYLAAAIWALHPVNVETVAWVTEMKNTQSALFFFLALLCFLRPDQPGSNKWYALSLLCGAAAMLSKPSTVVLPAVLLLCVWWQRRLHAKQVVRVLPFFVMALAMSMLTITEQGKHVHAGGTAEWSMNLMERCILAGRAVWFYAGKVLWPAHLVFVYPRWELKINSISEWLPVVGVGMVGTALWMWRRHPWARACTFGLGFFVTALLPVLGFFDIYYFRYSLVADHFQYLASAGLVACCAGGILWGTRKLPLPAGYLVCSMLVVAMAARTWRQAQIYSDAESLYRATIQQNPTCSLAHNNLGVILLDGGKTQDAIYHFEQALRANSGSFEADNNLGSALYKLGRTREAITYFERALELSPYYFPAHNNLGEALLNGGKAQEAIEHFERALRINPNYTNARNNLGSALLITGKLQDAISCFEQALRLKPDYADAHNNLGVIWLQTGKLEEAIRQFQQSLRIQPNSAEPHRNCGHALERLGRMREAIGQYEQALLINPNYLEAHNDLGSALLQVGEVRKSISQYEAALQIDPESASTKNNLAWVLAIYPPAEGGNPARAVALAEQACEASGNRSSARLDTLAAAYAAVGRFNDAIATAQKAAELARSARQPEIAGEIESRLSLYRDGKVARLELKEHQ